MKKKVTKKVEDSAEPECYFNPKNASEGECSSEKIDQRSFCFGCKQYICEAHSRNIDMPFGSHLPSVHLDSEDDV
jgi:hypothetical protein